MTQQIPERVCRYLQRILEEQGYLVAGPWPEVEFFIGQVVPEIIGGSGRFQCPVVVRGFATQAEWDEQNERFGSSAQKGGYERYLKVVAE